jgi:hypothetical protein
LTWLTYWRASPAWLLPDIDGFDLTGYRTEPDGTIYQISVSVPCSPFADVSSFFVACSRRFGGGALLLLLDVSNMVLTLTPNPYSATTQVPDEIARSSADRGHDMYWGYKLVPIAGGTRTRLSLVCQTNLNNWIPKGLVRCSPNPSPNPNPKDPKRTGAVVSCLGQNFALKECYWEA